MITMGGNAELELVDSMDPFSEGIIFSVMPPKKSWKNISNLSGGEKVGNSFWLMPESLTISIDFKLTCSCFRSAGLQGLHHRLFSLSSLMFPFSRHRCTLWTRLMQPWTSGTFQSWLTTSKTGQRMPNLSSSRFGTLHSPPLLMILTP